jgi:hypothetical protein
MTRRQGTAYVIGSDRSVTDAPTNKAPKGKPSDNYEVWTGEAWSAVMSDAQTFETLDSADEYVRANFEKVTGHRSVKKVSVRRPNKIAAPSSPATLPATSLPTADLPTTDLPMVSAPDPVASAPACGA